MLGEVTTPYNFHKLYQMQFKMLIALAASLGMFGGTGVVNAKEPIEPISPVKNLKLSQVELGKKLFF